MIAIKTPGEHDLEIPSIHPLLWMAREFIKKVPLKKLPEKDAEKWLDYQMCALKAIENAIKVLSPVKLVDRDFRCLNQRIQIVVDPHIFEPIEFKSERE